MYSSFTASLYTFHYMVICIQCLQLSLHERFPYVMNPCIYDRRWLHSRLCDFEYSPFYLQTCENQSFKLGRSVSECVFLWWSMVVMAHCSPTQAMRSAHNELCVEISSFSCADSRTAPAASCFEQDFGSWFCSCCIPSTANIR